MGFARIILVIALTALLSAIPAATASATKFEATSYPAELTGQATEPHVLTLESGLSLECANASFSGELSEAKREMELQPTYSGCKAFGFLSASVQMEGCKYRFDDDTYDFDVVCPGSNKAKITAGACEVQIGSQNGLELVDYLDGEGSPSTFTIENSAEKLRYTKTKDGFLCPFAGTGEREDGGYSGDTLIKAFSGKVQVGAFANAGILMRSYPKTYNFGQVKVGSTAKHTIKFRYVGGGTTELLSVSVSTVEGEGKEELFKIAKDGGGKPEETCAGEILNGTYCHAVIEFAPQAKGVKRKGEVAIDEKGVNGRHFEMIVEGEGT